MTTTGRHEIMHSIPSNWQALCREAAVERDPERLSALFLSIDHLVSRENQKERQRSEQTVRLPCVVVCPHCAAIIDPEQPRIRPDLKMCPWCEGRFEGLVRIDAHETDALR